MSYDHYQETKELSLKEDRATAHLLSMVLQEHIRAITKTMESYTNRPLLLNAVRNKNVEKTREHLVNIIKNDPYTESLVITDRGGTLWTSYPERPEVIGKNFAYREWYKGVSRNWKPYISDVTLRVVAEKDLAVQIVTPFIDGKGKIIGILLNTQRTVGLAKIMQQVTVDHGTFTNVVDRKGNTVFSSRFAHEKEITPYPFYAVKDGLISSAKNRSAAVADPLLGGRTYYLSYAPVAGPGWSVFVGRDSRQIVMSGLSEYIKTGVMTLVLFLLSVLSLVYFRKRATSQRLLDQIRADEEIRKERDQAQMYLDIAGVMIVALNAEGHITLINRRGCEILGYTEQEIMGQNWFDICLPEEMREEVKGVFNELMAGDTTPVEYHENPVLTKAGERRIIAFHNNILRNQSSQIIGLLSSGEDITERKQVEEEIRKLNAELEERVHYRTAQLEAANKELEAFSYSVSHDLRAPLRHISGYADLLIRDLHDAIPEKGKHYLDTIADSVHQMGTLIDDLLQFSRTGRQDMQQADLDMNNVLQEVLETIKRDSKGRGIEWAIATLPRVPGDYSLLRLVWSNLLGNAVKFTRTRENARIEIGVHEESGEYVFCVRDNGVGFDMQYAHKLFGVFQRLHSSKEFEGTGVGLANVRRIVLRHGGRTWAEAEPDKGAVFYFTLPKKKERKP